MEYVIAVYRSRNECMQAYNFLQSGGVNCAVSSTPRAAGVGCGLSVRFAKGDLLRVNSLLPRASTFVGYFVVRNTARGQSVTRLL